VLLEESRDVRRQNGRRLAYRFDLGLLAGKRSAAVEGYPP
jgi:hypothetical protein